MQSDRKSSFEDPPALGRVQIMIRGSALWSIVDSKISLGIQFPRC